MGNYSCRAFSTASVKCTCRYLIVHRLHESNIVRAGHPIGTAPDYWSGSGLTNRTVSSGLGPSNIYRLNRLPDYLLGHD